MYKQVSKFSTHLCYPEIFSLRNCSTSIHHEPNLWGFMHNCGIHAVKLRYAILTRIYIWWLTGLVGVPPMRVYFWSLQCYHIPWINATNTFYRTTCCMVTLYLSYKTPSSFDIVNCGESEIMRGRTSKWTSTKLIAPKMWYAENCRCIPGMWIWL